MTDPEDLPDEGEEAQPEPPPEGVPSIDDQEPRPCEYLDWSNETTKVVSGPLGINFQFPGRRFSTKAQAKSYWQERAGRIYADLSVPGRYIFRVRRNA